MLRRTTSHLPIKRDRFYSAHDVSEIQKVKYILKNKLKYKIQITCTGVVYFKYATHLLVFQLLHNTGN